MINNIYIHIPFCSNICSYCDFPKIYKNDKIIDQYLDSLEQEIRKKYQNEKVETIYIGGGTPSSLNINQLNKLFNILKIIKKDNLKEFTIECNIEDINIEKLELFKKNDINRLSIGLQTTNKDNLKLMNRNYSVDIDEKINLACSYFTNINIDLIYGLDANFEILKRDLEYLVSKKINHISTYSLIIEKNTVFYNQNYKRIDENIDYKMYEYICSFLKKHGYIHYEISNFCKENYESKHNLCYWNNQNYYGFGLGSSGYINNIRYTNTRSINNYLDNKYIIYEETLTKKDTQEYEMILGLRKIKGVSKKEFYDKYQEEISKVFDIKNLIDNNLLKENDEYIYIPNDKLYVQNSILINFIGGSNE